VVKRSGRDQISRGAEDELTEFVVTSAQSEGKLKVITAIGGSTEDELTEFVVVSNQS